MCMLGCRYRPKPLHLTTPPWAPRLMFEGVCPFADMGMSMRTESGTLSKSGYRCGRQQSSTPVAMMEQPAQPLVADALMSQKGVTSLCGVFDLRARSLQCGHCTMAVVRLSRGGEW